MRCANASPSHSTSGSSISETGLAWRPAHLVRSSRPSTPEASCWRHASSSARRFSPAKSRLRRRPFSTTTTAARHRSGRLPGLTLTPAQTTGTLTAPKCRLHFPLAEIAFDHRKAHLLRGDFVAAAALDDQANHAARHWRGRKEITEHAVCIVGGAAYDQHVSRRHCSTRDMDHRLSRVCASTVTAVPAASPPACRAHIRFRQADPAIGLVPLKSRARPAGRRRRPRRAAMFRGSARPVFIPIPPKHQEQPLTRHRS